MRPHYVICHSSTWVFASRHIFGPPSPEGNLFQHPLLATVLLHLHSRNELQIDRVFADAHGHRGSSLGPTTPTVIPDTLNEMVPAA